MKQVEVQQLYNPVPQRVRVSWSQAVEVRVAVRGSENQLPVEGLGPQDPRLSSPAEWERCAAKGRGTWGKYVAVCSVSISPLTHNPFTTISNKVWEVNFSKEVCSFVIIVDYISACICIRIVVSRLYNTSNAGGLENAEYPVIAISSRSIMTRSGYTRQGPIYGLNRTKLWTKLNRLK